MTQDHSLASKGSAQVSGKHKQQQQQQDQQKSQPNSIASVAVATDKRRATSTCGPLVHKRQHPDLMSSEKSVDLMLIQSKETTLSGMDESSGDMHDRSSSPNCVRTPASDIGKWVFRRREGSLDEKIGDTKDEHSQDTMSSENNDVLPSTGLKKYVIFYEGKRKTVFVQLWPDTPRIPVHQRHILQEPMKHRYGKLSHRARLLRQFEALKKRPSGITIPLLPKRVREEAKVRLMAWYRPLKFQSTCRLTVPEGSESEPSLTNTQRCPPSKPVS